MASLTINGRFNGPPESGNGGYVCGVLAEFVEGPSVVRLKVPPPLEVPLEVVPFEGRVRLEREGQVVAEAWSRGTDLEIPAPPSFEEAEEASKAYPGFEDHWFPHCFVCGPARESGDGLRIFAGPLAHRPEVACTWTPDTSLGDLGTAVRPEFLWAALDCPGAFSIPKPPSGGLLLGELAATLLSPLEIGEPSVLLAWPLDSEGRKHYTASAVFGSSGECAGYAVGTWFEVSRKGAG